MSSIVTNGSAIRALDTLRTIGRDLSAAQSRVSTGLEVSRASDNAAYWSIGTTMRSDDRAMSAVEDALALGAAKVDVAYIGMSNAIDVMKEFNAKLVAAREPGVDRNKINLELGQLRGQMRTIAENSSFNGENWLLTTDGASEPTRSMVTSFIRNSDGTVRVGNLDYAPDNGSFGQLNRLIDETSPGMYGILTQPAVASGIDVTPPTYYVFMKGNDAWPLAEEMGVSDATTNEEFDQMIQYADYMLDQMADAAATLGSMSSHIERQTAFVKDMRDASMRGVGRLRDADMNEESARLKALQTQQQLGLQALSIANSSADNFTALFR